MERLSPKLKTMDKKRNAPINIKSDEFRELGYELVDSIADFLDTISANPVTTGKSPSEIREIIGEDDLPEEGETPSAIIHKAQNLLIDDSLFNGHPKFLGYITSSPAPLGMLGDFLAAAVNQNMGAQILSPVSTEIEKQTVKWLSQLVGVGSSWGGLLVSGGNMANFTAFLAGRRAKIPDELVENGLQGLDSTYITYCAKSTHTWIEKAVTLFGQGKKSLRWIDSNKSNKMDLNALRSQIIQDKKEGYIPMMAIGTAGDVSTGAVDDLRAISDICKEFNLWFHVDGAYGAPAAVLPELKSAFSGLEEADSIALDPHKWLYSPLEAGCTLIRNPIHLVNAFSSRPEYYNFGINAESSVNFYEYGLQNSRGFRALKVWMTLQQVGRKGYAQMIKKDIELAQYLYDRCTSENELLPMSCNLSITTFRYVPSGFKENLAEHKTYLNELNEALVNNIQQDGDLFVSNALVDGYYCMRACIVNFRTSNQDIDEIVASILIQAKRILEQNDSRK